MNSKRDADILADAREYLEHHGWEQGEMRDEDGHVCSLGAIVLSQGWQNEDGAYDCHEVYLADLRRIGEKLINVIGIDMGVRDGLSDVAAWNDAPETTVQQVLDVFAKAEKIERAGFDPDAA